MDIGDIAERIMEVGEPMRSRIIGKPEGVTWFLYSVPVRLQKLVKISRVVRCVNCFHVFIRNSEADQHYIITQQYGILIPYCLILKLTKFSQTI